MRVKKLFLLLFLLPSLSFSFQENTSSDIKILCSVVSTIDGGDADFGLISIVILNQKIKKYNVYVLGYDMPGVSDLNCAFIVNTYRPKSLEVAKKIFPNVSLTIYNYGF